MVVVVVRGLWVVVGMGEDGQGGCVEIWFCWLVRGLVKTSYIKAVTHFCEVEWWRTLMVECVTVF